MHSLSLGVRRRSDAKFFASNVTPPKPTQVWERDDYTCQCCGFRAQKFQRIAPRLDSTDFRQLSSWFTVCTFCDQVMALESVSAMGSGLLVWLPELSQIELNHLMRAIYVAKARGDGELADLAQRSEDMLLARRSEAKKRLGADDPHVLATVLIENMSADDYAKREPKLAGVRLLPLEKRLVITKTGEQDQYPAMLDYWLSSDGPYAALPPASWLTNWQAFQAQTASA